jgi:hypothetical protein
MAAARLYAFGGMAAYPLPILALLCYLHTHLYDFAVACLFALLLTCEPRLHALDAFFQQRLCFAT